MGGLYRPPNSGSNYFELILESIDRASNSNIPDVILTGDFNINCYQQTSNKILDAIHNYGFTQLINDFTHYTENSQTLIDLMIVSKRENVLTSGVLDPFFPDSIRYHCPILLLLNFRKHNFQSFKRQIWRFKDGNYNLYRNLLASVSWNIVIDDQFDNDVDSITDEFSNKILEIAKKCIPNRQITVRPKDPPWLSNNIRRLIRTRKRMHRKAKRENTEYYWAKFRKIRNDVVHSIRNAKDDYYKNLADKVKSESVTKTWWKLTSIIFENNENTKAIPTIEHETGTAVSNVDKAEVFNSYFIKQSKINDSNKNLPPDPTKPTTKLDNIFISPNDVHDVLLALDVSKAVGPDGVNPRLLKEGADQLCQPLSRLFNLSLSKGKFPTSWKKANVTPVFKKGDRSDIQNYRPISLLSCIGKVMERCINKYFFNFLINNHLITEYQSGFISGDSTTN